jgi:MSHA biogenesis protein MshM
VLNLITERLLELNAAGKQVVLLLDEAQAMPDDSLEALRLLTNLETEKRKLLQVVLFGQQELDTRLAQRKLRQLKQRIVFSYQLSPLSRQALGEYVQHRLHVAGYQGPSLFSTGLIKRLHRNSRGIPRLVNLLCHKALMAAYGCGVQRISAAHLHRASVDTDDVKPGKPRWLAIASGLAGLITLTSASLLYAYSL